MTEGPGGVVTILEGQSRDLGSIPSFAQPIFHASFFPIYFTLYLDSIILALSDWINIWIQIILALSDWMNWSRSKAEDSRS